MKENTITPDSQTKTKNWTEGKFITSFNNFFDFFSRITKALIFMALVALILWKLPLIDWESTSNNLIASSTPIQLDSQQTTTSGSPSQEAAALTRTNNDKTLSETTKSPTHNPVSETQMDTKKLASAPQMNIKNPAYQTQLQPATQPDSKALEIYQDGKLVLRADRSYDVSGGDYVVFNKLLVESKPDYYKPLNYKGVRLQILRIDKYIGLLVKGSSMEGPVLQGVSCKILR